MSTYIEIPPWREPLAFRAFPDTGAGAVTPHRHKEIEVIQVKSGHSVIGIANATLCLPTGTVFVVASGQPHYFLPTPNSMRHVFQFDLSLFDNLRLQCSISDLARVFSAHEPCSLQWPSAATAAVNAELDTLFVAGSAPLDRAAIMGHTYLLLTQLMHTAPTQTAAHVADGAALRAKTSMQQLNTIYDYIDAHFLETISLSGVAAVLGFNPQYFARFFKRNTGTTFGQFLTNYRLMKARFLLASSDEPMAAIALACGFGSVKTFHRLFKAATGSAPLSYRHQMATTSG